MDGASTMFADYETASRQCGWAFFMARAFSLLSFLLGSSSFAEITSRAPGLHGFRGKSWS
jgi:hypothetical protein